MFFNATTRANTDVTINLTHISMITWTHQDKQWPGRVTEAELNFPGTSIVINKESAIRLRDKLSEKRQSSLPPAGWGFI